jgi:ATP-dependent Clp protease ATP-binding subunit ClpA
MEGDGVAAMALGNLGVNVDEVRDRVEDLRSRGVEAPNGSPPFTPEAKKTLELSLREALQLGHNYIGTEHMLLALLRQEEEMGAQLLAGAGIDPSQVRQQVMIFLEGYKGAAGAATLTSGEPPVVRQVESERSTSFREVGRGWVASVTRTGRTPLDYKAAYDDLKDMFESIGVELGDDDLAHVVVTPVITPEGPGISLNLGHLLESE